MLFFYGTGSSTAGTYPLPGMPCPYCGSQGTLRAVVVARYAHFFWIPLFPIGKRAVTVCAHCQQQLAQNQLPPAYRAPVEAVRQQAPTPITHYLGLLLLGGLLLLLMGRGFFGTTKKTDTATTVPTRADTEALQAANKPLLADPKVGDIYAIRTEKDSVYILETVETVGEHHHTMWMSDYHPRTLADIRQHPDSIENRRIGSTFYMPRTTLEQINRVGNLTIVRN